ncbi:hypothetical protein VM1G_01622 [Cytospora mali]|uniref:Uncharacterized protein n=1 Tax=Cytospora mali TaxID=578113 RepID=A0A194VR71_CYTMA|nr:hypothetical protein VM1G_01622 [Valsa mali]
MHINASDQLSSVSKPCSLRTWQDGDIAFLKTCNAFSPRDYNNLIASGYIHEKATCHPVIILKANPGKAIITPVTAFSSGPENDFLPPWQQVYHKRKNLDDFRAFVGTRRPNNKHASLKLADTKMQMPKPQASWVYLKHFWTVPDTVLGRFNKAAGILQVAKDSLSQLRQDIRQKYGFQLRDALDRLGASPAVQPAPVPAPAPAPPAPKDLPAAFAAAPAPAPAASQAVRQAAGSHTAPVFYPHPAMAVCSQQATGKAFMTYSKVVSGSAR